MQWSDDTHALACTQSNSNARGEKRTRTPRNSGAVGRCVRKKEQQTNNATAFTTWLDKPVVVVGDEIHQPIMPWCVGIVNQTQACFGPKVRHLFVSLSLSLLL
jgi:hypothetical protein